MVDGSDAVIFHKNDGTVVTEVTEDVDDYYVYYTFGTTEAAALLASHGIKFSSSFADAEENNKWMNLQDRGATSDRWLNTNTAPSNGNVNADGNGYTDTEITANFAFIGDPYHFSVVNQCKGSNWCFNDPRTDTQDRVYISQEAESERRIWALVDPVSSATETVGSHSYKRFHVLLAPTTFDTRQYWYNNKGYDQLKVNTRLQASDDYVVKPALSRSPITFKVISSDGTLLASATTTDTYAEGATVTLSAAFPAVLKRAFCDESGYTFYTALNGAEGSTSVDESTVVTSITKASTTETIYVNYKLNSDGTSYLSTSADTPKWIHLKNGTSYLTSTANGVLSSTTTAPTSIVSLNVDEYLFALVGNPYSLRVISKKVGDSSKDLQPATASNGAAMSITATGVLSTWEAVRPTSGTNTFILVQHGTYTLNGSNFTGQFFNRNSRQLTIGNQDNGSHSMTSETPAERMIVRYVLVNKSGEKAMWYSDITTGTLNVPNQLKSPLANSYTIHATAADAISGDSPITTVGQITEKEGSYGVVYVGYTINTSALSNYVNGIWKWTVNGGNGTVWERGSNMVRHNSIDNWTATNGQFWTFEGSDPYRLDLRNVLDMTKFVGINGDGESRLSFLDSRETYYAVVYEHDNSKWSIMAVPTTADYAAATYDNTETFGFFVGLLDAAQLVSFNLKPSGNTGARSGSGATVVITTQGVVYYIINNSGRLSIPVFTSDAAGSAPSLPTAYQSPLAQNFRYYSDRACTQTMNSIPSANSVVYVRYDVRPDAALDLTGRTQYNIYYNETNKKYWHWNHESNNVTLRQTDTEPDSETKVNAQYLWTLSGDDPYDISISSAANSNKRIDVENDYDYSWVTDASNRQGFVLLQQGENYELALIGYPLSKSHHWYMADLDDSATANSDQVGVQKDYASGDTHLALQIVSPFTPNSVTYHLLNASGTQIASATMQESGTLPPLLPAMLRSVQVDTYTYYKDNACTNVYSNNEVLGTATDVYVKYTYNPASDIPFSNNINYNMTVNGSYAYASSVTAVATEATEANIAQDTRIWSIVADGTDPYAVKVKNKDNGKYLTYSSLTGNSVSLSLSNTGSIFFLRAGHNSDTYELVAVSNADYATTYYTLGLSGSTAVLYQNTEAARGAGAVQIQFTPANLTYHVINLSGKEALLYSPTAMPASYDTGFPAQYRSPLAKNYKFYKRSQFNSATVDGHAVYTIKSGEQNRDIATLGQLSNMQPGDVFVMYEYDATAAATMGIDLSGTAPITLHNKASKHFFEFFWTKDSQRLRSRSKITQKHWWQEWKLNGNGKNDPYDVTLSVVKITNSTQTTELAATNQTDGNKEANVCLKEWANGECPNTSWMILNKDADGYVHLMVNRGPSTANFQYLYENTSAPDNALKTTRNVTEPSGDQFKFKLQPVYTYHVVNLNGKETVSAIEGRIMNDADAASYKPQIPLRIQSPLVKKYLFYDKSQVSIGSTTSLKVGATELTDVRLATDRDIYVFYNKADIDNTIFDLTGQTSYNFYDERQKRYAYDNGGNQVTNTDNGVTPSNTDRQSKSYLWSLKGGDPYNVKIYNLNSTRANQPIGLKQQFTNDNPKNNWSQRPHFDLNSSDNNVDSYCMVWGGTCERGEHQIQLLATATISDKQDWYLANTKNNGIEFCWYANELRDANSSTDNMSVVNLEPANNARHTYVIINRRGKEALRMTVDGTQNVAPQVPLELRSPLATNYQCWSNSSCTTPLATTGTGSKTIYVTYDRDATKTAIDLTGQKYYYLKTNGQYDHIDDTQTPVYTAASVDDSKLADYAWLLDADEDPYEIILRLPGVEGKALGTPQYTNGNRRRAAAKEHALQLYDDADSHVMTFALLGGATQANMASTANLYALVVSGHDDVAESNQVADITGNQFNYVARRESTLILMQGDYTTDLADVAMIGNADDESQTEIAPLLIHYHYHILAPETGHEVIESYTCTDTDGASAGMTAAEAFPEALVRLGAPVSKMRFYASATELTTSEQLTTAYDEATFNLKLGLDKLHVYARFEVDENELPYYYSDPSALLENMEWYQWKGYAGWEGKWRYKKYKSSDSGVEGGLETTGTEIKTDAELSGAEYLFAFIGDPYRTKIINKAAGKDKYLSVSSKANNSQAIFAAATTSANNEWGLATRLRRNSSNASFRIIGTSSLENPLHLRAGTFHIDNYSGTSDGEFNQVIIPLTIHYTYNVINLSGKRAVRVKAKTTGSLTTETNLNTLWDNDEYLKWERVGGEEAGSWSYYGPEAMSVSNGIYTLKSGASAITTYTPSTSGDAISKNVNIYVKYTGSNNYRKKGNCIYTISKKNDTTKYLYLDDDGHLSATAQAPAGKYASKYLWYVKPTLVNGYYDPYDIRLYSLIAPNSPVSAGAINSDEPLTIGSEANAQVFAMTGHAAYGLMLIDSNIADGDLFAFLRIDRAPKAEFRSEIRNGTETIRSNHNDIALDLTKVTLTYHIYNLQGDKAIGRAVETPSELAELYADNTITVPSAIRSPLVKDGNWHFWQSWNTTTKTGATEMTTYDDVADGNIHVTYDYQNSDDGTFDLSGETAYNIHSPYYAKQTYGNLTKKDVYWCYPTTIISGSANQQLRHAYETTVGSGEFNRYSSHTLADDKVTNTYTVTDDAMLWMLSGNDPYNISLYSMANSQAPVGLLPSSSNIMGFSGNPLRFIILNSATAEGLAAGDYELVRAGGDNTIRKTWLYYDNTSDKIYSETRNSSYSPDQSARVHFTPRSVDYAYHIINLSGHKALLYTGKGIEGKEAKQLPASVQSPLATNMRFYKRDQLDSVQVDNRWLYTVKAEEVANKQTTFPTAETDPETGERIIPQLYVFYDYDAKARTNLDLNGQRYYYLAAGLDSGKRYVHKESTAEARTSTTYVKPTQGDLGGYLMMVDGGGDPYDVRLRPVIEPGVTLNSGDIGEGSNAMTFVSDNQTTAATFCLLPGNGADNEYYTLVAATGDDISDNHYAYVGLDGATLSLLRGAGYDNTLAALQVQLEVPFFDYRYRVVNLSDEIAIQLTVPDSEGGAQPELPAAIRSPFADITGYYLVGQYDITGEDPSATYALKAREQSIDVDDGLPYYDADIYVEYQYNGDETLDITGRKYYNLLSDAQTNYVYNDGSMLSATATTPTPLATDSYMWGLNGNGSSGIDPYAVTLTSHEATPATLSPYVLLTGSTGDQWVLAKANTTADPGAATSPTDYTLLTSNGTTIVESTGKLTADGAQLTFKGIRIKVEYYVIDNTKHRVAIRYTIDATGDNALTAEGGDRPQIPDLIKSPLAYNFKYYSQADINGSGAFATYAIKGDELQAFGYTDQEVYITYDYDNANSQLDLNGQVKYTISLGDNYMGRPDNTTNAWAPVSNYKLTGDSNADKTKLGDKDFLWKLTGTDPYRVHIYNMTANPRTENPRGAMLHSRNNLIRTYTGLWFDNAFPILQDDSELSFVILPGSSPKEGGYALVYAYSSSNSDDHAYGLYNRFRTSNAGYAFVDYNDGTWNATTRNDINNPGQYTKNQWVTPFSSTAFTTLTFTPSQSIPVVYHLTQKMTGTTLTSAKEDIAVLSKIEIPAEWKRKYCDYSFTYYKKDGTDAEGNAVEVPASKDDGTEVSGSMLIPLLYVAEDDETTQLDIYIDYTVRDYGHKDATGADDGIPFRRIASTPTMVQAVLNNTGGLTDVAFDLSSYDKLLQEVPVHNDNGDIVDNVPRKDFLYFMVMNTNDDYSRGSQYFLRRQDNGRIAWLNADSQPHAARSKNINNWTYSRCAEAYRANDHAPFEEKHWLWAFAGDPYDLYVYNASAVAEEVYDPITGETTVTTHREHMTSWQRLADDELVAYTPGYDETSPARYSWGLANGTGTASDQAFSLVAMPTVANGMLATESDDDSPLFWRMNRSNRDRANEVMLMPRASTFSGLDYNVMVLPYEPTKFEDVRLVIRRKDEVDAYTGKFTTPLASQTDATVKATQQKYLNGDEVTVDGTTKQWMTTGVSRMYFSIEDRQFAQGDVIRHDDETTIPFEVRRAFCDYTFYSNDFRSSGDYTIVEGATRGEQKKDGSGNPVYDEMGRPVYTYLDTNGQETDPQTVYASYVVTSDIFLRQHPTKEQVTTMTANNDHVYFMDFTDNLALEGYDRGHHAYFDETETFKSQVTVQAGRTEKRHWNGTAFEDDRQKAYNDCQFRTTPNRMTSVPENLKWYFVGDPYRVQVYCTKDEFNKETITSDGKLWAPGTLGSNLCRFDPTESNFQFVVDCVHLRLPTDAAIDNEHELTFHDQDGNTLGTITNPNYGKPYYKPFYWECVPAQTDRQEAFALRFKADNPVQGYRNVYYYLAHDGITRSYKESQNQNHVSYRVNLSYDEDNALLQSSKYPGYHKANGTNCVIHLVQPAKVYVSAYKAPAEGAVADDYSNCTLTTKEELTEYFGVGETLYDVPRHLKRKYVKYGDWQYQHNNSATWHAAESDVASTGFVLDADKNSHAYNMEQCTSQTDYNIDEWLFTSSGQMPASSDHGAYTPLKRASYKLRVAYTMDDLTKDGIHLFTTTASFAAGAEPQWLDVKVGNAGNNGWLYYNKTNTATDGTENQTTLVSNYSYQQPQKDGWNNGLKGLHWAFVGDPYEFTAVNRRRWEDEGKPTTAADGKNCWLGTAYAKNNENVSSTTKTYDPATGEYYTTTSTTKQNVWQNYVQLGDTPANGTLGQYGTASTPGSGDNGNTTWGLVYCKTGGNTDFFMRTASLKTADTGESDGLGGTVGDYSNNDSRNMTNSYERLQVKSFTDGASQSNFAGMPFSLSTLVSDIQRVAIRTAVAMDDDQANNDCFDADVEVRSTDGELRLRKERVEVRYGNAVESMPVSLRRYGCNYTCYIDYDEATRTGITVADFDAVTPLKDGKTFRQLVADAITAGTRLKVTYVYHVADQTSQFFTTTQDAQTDDYTWMNAYFSWLQYYSGTNVEVQKTKREFVRYVYSSDGHIIDEVWREVTYTEVVSNPTTPYETKGYINTHTDQTPVYGDESTQKDDDRLKWSLIGDPYGFTMKNYAQYLPANSGVNVYTDASGNVLTRNYGTGQTFALAVDANGNPYLAIVYTSGDNQGQVVKLVDFEYSATSNKSLYAAGEGVNLNDPTGNSLATTYSLNGKTATVKPFYLANLTKYADVVVYHLVMAHQHTLDAEDSDKWTEGSGKGKADDQLTGYDANGSPTGVYSRLLEFLRYWGKKDNTSYLSSSISSDKTTAAGQLATNLDSYITSNTDVSTLLSKHGTLRNFLSYPIADQEAARVGIGIRPQVPWYMKRQFCQYTMYQRDVMRSVADTSNPVVVKKNGVDCYVWANDVSGEVDTVAVTAADKPSPWYKACHVKWESIFDKSHWTKCSEGDNGAYQITTDDVTAWGKGLVAGEYRKQPTGYSQADAQQGQPLDRLLDCHNNRKVIVDVVYNVNTSTFRFADQGRNTTAWYQMMTNNYQADGLLNFSYKDGIGGRLDRKHHYTNNYLWAPEGDPYGFVLRSRYATINGTGYDDVAVTTEGKLPKGKDASGSLIYIDGTGNQTPYTELTAADHADVKASYTGNSSSTHIPFNHKRIIHRRDGQDGATTDGATNAVYEMFVGGYEGSFLMHPTAAWMDNSDVNHQSYYMVHETTTHDSYTAHRAYLEKFKIDDLRYKPDANWRLECTPEQLIPYFQRAGYVGGIDPVKAQNFTYADYYQQLQQAVNSGTTLDFATLAAIQKVVYSGTFYQSDGTTVVSYTDPRPTGTNLPMRFVSTNLVNMKPGYYRIQAFSEEALNLDGRDLVGNSSNIKGVTGPRYISGYRFDSAKSDNNDTKNNGGRWLHFFETDMAHSDIHTYADLKAKITAAHNTGQTDRDMFDHPAMSGNIEILPADFDPSSIFQFEKAETGETYDRYNIKTQGLTLWARPGSSENDATAGTHEFGRTELVQSTPSTAEGYNSNSDHGGWDNCFRLEDIGGAATTIRLRKMADENWDKMVAENLKTNYVCIDGKHRYRVTCHKDNEMVEIGDHYTTDGINGIQDTKWLLQPVGIREQWPFNEMPLRLEVHQGGVKNQDATEPELSAADNQDPYYYGSLYVPFDTRLGATTDAAFTLTTTPLATAKTVTMQSVSQINGMGNAQFIPAGWPVVIRSNIAKNSVTLKNQDGSNYATRHYVNLFLPNDAPTAESALSEEKAKITLRGSYLERTLTAADLGVSAGSEATKTVMVFGLPFKDHRLGHDDTNAAHHEYDDKKQVGWYVNDNWARESYSGYTDGTYKAYKAHEQQYPAAATAAFPGGGTVATDTERSNLYVYHNRAFLVIDHPLQTTTPDPSRDGRHIVALFDGDEPPAVEWQQDRPIDDASAAPAPWPCDVYDLQGRRVAENETPATLRRNHPRLRPGVYLFAGRKVVVR